MNEEFQFVEGVIFTYQIKFCAVALTAAFALVSNANSQEKGTSVTGKITFNGQPLAEGKVTFRPEKGKPVEAKIKDGEFSIAKMPTGTMTVTVRAKGVPPKYADAKTSDLRVTIAAGANMVDLELK